MTETGPGVLRPMARLSMAAGAVGSVALTLEAGRRNPSVLLMAIFAVWVVLPFVALAWTDRASGGWPRPTRVRLAILTLVESAVSLGVYGVMVFGRTGLKLAAPFLILPPILLALVVVFVVAARRAP